jgi:MFS family permease
MSKLPLYLLQFFMEGSQASLLILLPFLQKDFHLSIFEVGLLSMALSVTSIIFTLFSSHVADKIGVKGVVAIAIIANLAMWGLLVLTNSPFLLWLIYALNGISSGLFDPMGSSLAAKAAESHNRGKVIGNFKGAGDLGTFSMTAVTTFLVAMIFWKTTSLIYTVMSCLVLIFFIIIQKKTNKTVVKEAQIPSHFGHLLKNHKYVLSMIIGFLDNFASSSLFIFLPFLLILKGIDIKETGFFTSLLFVGYFMGRVLLGRVADKFGTANVFIFAEVCMALLITSLILLNSYVLIIVTLFLLGVFVKGTSPIVKVMVADSLERHQYEKGYSLNSFGMKLANVFSRSSFGYLAGVFGIQSVFILAGIIALLAVIPSKMFYDIKK